MQNIDVAGTIAANLTLFFWLSVAWIIAVVYSAWHCLTRLRGIDRLTWLIALLLLPYVGILYYWLAGADESETAKRKYKGLTDL